MEATGGKGKVHETTFNVGLNQQFVPFWNGLMHLIGVVKDHVITMRYDWYNIIKECEIFEKEYLNTSGFCESCVFNEMPSYLNGVLQQAWKDGITDCKEIARDNDIIYTFCVERKRTRRVLWAFIFFLLFLIIGFFYWSTLTPKLNYNSI